MEFERGTGFTLNVSAVGVLFATDTPCHRSESLEFVLSLGELRSGGTFRVRCFGEVVRVEERGAGFAVAVRLDSYSLESPLSGRC